MALWDFAPSPFLGTHRAKKSSQQIDRKITKIEMRKQAGIATNMLAKMGKDEPVSMETLVKICVALDCGFDDIVEIQKSEKRGVL